MRLKILITFLIIAVAVLNVETAHAFNFRTDKTTAVVRAGGVESVDLILDSPIDDIVIVDLVSEIPWFTIPQHIRVGARKTETVPITFSPPKDTKPSIYKISVILASSNTNEVQQLDLSVVVRTADLAIEKAQVTGSLEPLGSGVVEFFIKNYENELLTTRFVGSIKNSDGSDVINFDDSLDLGPREFRVIQKKFSLPECVPQGQRTLSAKMLFKDLEVFSISDTFEILPKYIPKVERTEDPKLLQSDVTIGIRNLGNVRGTTEVTEDISGVLFFSGDKPASTEGGKYRWLLEVAPCETKFIRYNINYSPIASMVIIIIALWFIFFRVRTTRIKKFILQRRIIEEGKEFTVGIELKGYTGLKNIEIRDFVPALFEVKDVPGIKPVKTKKPSGTELTWKFNEIKSGEERLLVYKIVPILGISGKIKLPRAIMTFSYFGKNLKKSSQITTIGLEIKEESESIFDKLYSLRDTVKKLIQKQTKKEEKEKSLTEFA